MSNFSNAEQLFRKNDLEALTSLASGITRKSFSRSVYLRGLIEFSNHCISNCLYCGIRRDNGKVNRYRLTDEEIFTAVDTGYARGLRTFVLQGGEDPWFTVEKLAAIASGIKKRTHGEAALTLSCGMLTLDEYRALKEAGADRYLLRFETSDPELHKYLRDGVDLDRRLEALENLKSLGFQTGSGFMVGLPGETEETVINNIKLCRELDLDMAGIGPFIPHQDTPLAEAPQIPLKLALKATALLRIACPDTHIPATTAAGTLEPDGREQMIRCGANVVMPNLSPITAKKDYLLYPGKICLDEDGLQCIGCLGLRIASVDGKMSFERGDGRMERGETGDGASLWLEEAGDRGQPEAVEDRKQEAGT
jgi:biotin synthase